MADISSKTKLTFSIAYDISSTEYAKIVNLVGASFVLVPILNGVDVYTYKYNEITTKYFKDCFTWGSSFSSSFFASAQPQWDYGTGVNAGTNVIEYTTSDYNLYISSDTDLSLSTSIKFAVYPATVVGTKYYPSGSRVDTIDYSDLVSVSCTFTQK